MTIPIVVTGIVVLGVALGGLGFMLGRNQRSKG